MGCVGRRQFQASTGALLAAPLAAWSERASNLEPTGPAPNNEG
jgi:hypothetical protein